MRILLRIISKKNTTVSSETVINDSGSGCKIAGREAKQQSRIDNIHTKWKERGLKERENERDRERERESECVREREREVKRTRGYGEKEKT